MQVVVLHDAIRVQFLKVLAEQSRRVPIAVLCLLIVMALVASQHLPLWVVSVWFLAAAGILLVRRAWLAALPTRDTQSLDTREKIAIALSLVNGIAHGSSLAAFALLTETERAFFSVLLLGLTTGAVGTTAGHRRVYLVYTLPIMVPLIVLWAISPGVITPSIVERSLSLLFAMYFMVMLGLAKDAWRTFCESVQIRFQEAELNEQLQAALDRANQANQAKTRFLAAASHDLRQPLHTVGLLVAALSLRRMDGRDREIVDLLNQVTVALSEQLDALLDISKLDAGVVQVDARVLDLHETVSLYSMEMRAVIEGRGLQALSHCDTGVYVRTDPALLMRILRNLTENAVKFTATGHVSIQLLRQGDDAAIIVSDSGQGIAPEHHEKVFEEFYQVGNPERDRSRGLGLGLSIVRRLAELLGARLSMTSTPGSGTRFELLLPLVPAPVVPTPAPHDARDSGPLRLQVLVLDDEGSVRKGLILLLQELDCDCVEASSSAEALAAAQATRPDIVLADLRLRGEDTGIAAIRDIRAQLGWVPALLISGDTAPDRLQEADRAGIRLLHKPVPMQVLRNEIMRAMDARPKKGE